MYTTRLKQTLRVHLTLLATAAMLGCGDASGVEGRGTPDNLRPPPSGSDGDPFDNPDGIVEPGDQVIAGNKDGLDTNTCARAEVTVDRIRPRVVFLVDSSSSMSENFGDVTRWNALRTSLLADDGLVPAMQDLVKFGLVTYAGPRFTTCPAYRYAAPAPGNEGFVSSAFPDAPPEESSTPTGAAMDWAIDNAFVEQMNGPDERPEPQFMIFATDGEPNGCAEGSDEEPARDFDSVIAAAHKAASRGIHIFVVSLADATGDFADHLAEIATIGKTETVYSPESKTDLANELQVIIGTALSCEVELRGRVRVGHECEGTVTLKGEPLDCNGEHGWELVDATHVQLNGTACEDFRFTPTARVEAAFPCAALE